MDLEEIGQKVFTFALYYSIIMTVITLALISAGLPAEAFNLPLFAPATRLYEVTMSIASRLPQNATIMDLLTGLSFGIVGGVLQFTMALLFGVLALVQTLATLVPPDVRFLVVPLFFVGAFIQTMVWYYLAIKLYNTLKSWLPFSWVGEWPPR